MTWEIGLLLGLLAAATVMFLLERAGVDAITLGLLIALALSGILTPEEAFSGFANEVIVILASIFVLSGALTHTGVMDRAAHWIADTAGASELRAILILLVMSALMSAFISNTTTTAVLIPTVISLCRKTGLKPGRLLMPIAFASMLGGTCTLIGTSTNLAASGMIAKLGLAPFGVFEFTAVGAVVAVLGVAYLAGFGRLLLPHTRLRGEVEEYGLRKYLTELRVVEDSSLAGRTLQDLKLSERGLNVAEIIRGRRRTKAYSNSKLREGDVLVVAAEPKDLLRARSDPGIEVLTESEALPADLEADLEAAESRVIEAVIPADSSFTNLTVKDLDMRRRFGSSVLAVYRRGGSLATHIRTLRLRAGDVLLLLGSPERLQPLLREKELLVLGEMKSEPFDRRRGLYAVASLLAAVVLSGAGLLPVSIAFLAAALLVLTLGCIQVDDVYALIEWRLLILIGGMTSVGLAMEKTEAGAFLAGWLAESVGGFGLRPVLAAFGLLTMLLTQPLSNAAAALVVLPVALATAARLDIEPRLLAVMVTLSASLSFIAPLEPASLLVYGPGKYRFRDFVRAGLPLSMLALLILVWLVPLIWG